MALKIICVEEHLGDDGLAKATGPALAEWAPYLHDLGSRYQEPEDGAGDRPRLQAPERLNELISAPPEERLAAMDAHGIDVQVLSYSQPTQFAPRGEAAALARAANDRLAEAMRRHPERFGGFSTLPWQDPQAAVTEVKRTATALGLTATMLMGHPDQDAFIDDQRYAPVLETLEALGVALYVHPGPPLPAVQRPYYGGFNADATARLSLYGWGWHNEAGIQVVRLILSGTLDRFPKLKIISGHWGEMVPFFLQRMDDALPPEATGLKRTISQTYRDQVFVTPSGMLNEPHFRFICDVLGPQRIMFSVDYPYLTLSGARAWLEGLSISEDDRSAIAHGTAERLLRLRH